MSCVERCLHFRGKYLVFGTQQSVPLCRGVLISGVSFRRGSTVSPVHGVRVGVDV